MKYDLNILWSPRLSFDFSFITQSTELICEKFKDASFNKQTNDAVADALTINIILTLSGKRYNKSKSF